MKRGIWMGLAAALAFIAILLARLPASWLSGFLPNTVACAEIGGTVWSGSCVGLVAQGLKLGDLAWQLRAAPLLMAKISGHVNLQHTAGTVTADLDAKRSGDLDAHGVVADIALDPALLQGSPPQLRGKIHANLAHVTIEKGLITSLEGHIDVRDLEKRGEDAAALGNYTVSFPAKRATAQAGEVVGDLDSTSGPWQVSGVVRLTGSRSVVEGTIAAGSGAPPDAVAALGYLGPPDAQGRRPFSIENEF